MGTELWTAISILGGLLLSGNIFFVKRLVEKVESLSQLPRDVNAIGNQLRELKADIKDLRKIEIEVAVMKSHLQPAEAGKSERTS